MELAGYSFKVLDNAFTSHRGFSYPKKVPKFRSAQIYHNNKRLRGFIKDLEKRYGIKPKTYLSKNKKPKKKKSKNKKKNPRDKELEVPQFRNTS